MIISLFWTAQQNYLFPELTEISESMLVVLDQVIGDPVDHDTDVWAIPIPILTA